MTWPFIAAIISFASIFIGVALIKRGVPGDAPPYERGLALVLVGIVGLIAVAVGVLL